MKAQNKVIEGSYLNYKIVYNKALKCYLLENPEDTSLVVLIQYNSREKRGHLKSMTKIAESVESIGSKRVARGLVGSAILGLPGLLFALPEPHVDKALIVKLVFETNGVVEWCKVEMQESIYNEIKIYLA